MFSVEIKINGSMIAHIYGRNLGPAEDHPVPIELTDRERNSGDAYLYKYEYYTPENRGIREGKVVHVRDDGIEPLLRDILASVMEEEGHD